MASIISGALQQNRGRLFPGILHLFLAFSLIVPAVSQQAPAPRQQSPIHFSARPIGFTLNNCESPQRHAPETMAGGVAVFDYDNDGRPDIFFTNGANLATLQKDAPKYWNRLYHNNGDGTFTDVTEKAGLKGTGFDMGVAIGDYDNDGYEDIFVAGVYRNTLYHNNGDGTFTDVSEKAGITKLDKEYGPLWSVGAAWVDVNNDGLLDLFVVNYVQWNYAHEPDCRVGDKPEYCHPKFFRETPNQLFLNKGNGVFEDISAASGIRACPGRGMGVGIADFDGDGRPDIFVANDKLFNFLFHNDGNNHFTEMAFESGVALPSHGNLISGMGVDARDLNNDGRPDVVLVALANETFPVYLNSGHMQFSEATASSGMTALSLPMAGYSPNIGDFDNDGWKDIFVSRGDVASRNMADRQAIDQNNSVFRNLGNGKWAALTAEAGFDAQPPRRHRGAALGDFLGNGKLDVVVSALGEPAELWINDSPNSNHWIELALVGRKSNRDAIGAQVKITVQGKSQWDHVSHAAGYASSSATPLHFGLGGAERIDAIEIQWPSGIHQVLSNVAADHRLTIVEPVP
jgi:hypothetical protein